MTRHELNGTFRDFLCSSGLVYDKNNYLQHSLWSSLEDLFYKFVLKFLQDLVVGQFCKTAVKHACREKLMPLCSFLLTLLLVPCEVSPVWICSTSSIAMNSKPVIMSELSAILDVLEKKHSSFNGMLFASPPSCLRHMVLSSSLPLIFNWKDIFPTLNSLMRIPCLL